LRTALHCTALHQRFPELSWRNFEEAFGKDAVARNFEDWSRLDSKFFKFDISAPEATIHSAPAFSWFRLVPAPKIAVWIAVPF
jgi:hypothetical protein